MRTLMTWTYLLLTIIGYAQFYPNANAVWCGVDDDGGPPGFDVQFLMGADPDTLIGNVVYKKISEYNDLSGSWLLVRDHFVRSDENGKGYYYVPDSLTEFVTGDITAQTGDTIHDVLWSVSYSGSLHISDFVCDSVITLSNDGVTVYRHYVDHSTFQQSQIVFWQAGMGASWGPSLRQSGQPFYASVEDIVQFSQSPPNNGLPGGPAWCAPITVGLSELSASRDERLLIGPNPSTGAFALSTSTQVLQTLIFDPQGREVLRTRATSFDLSNFAPGTYTAVITTAGGRQAVRLMVVR